MRYINKIPPTDKELSNKLISEGWTKLKEPSGLGKAILLSTPFMFLNGAISIFIAYSLYEPLKEILTSDQLSLSLNISLGTLIYIAIAFIFLTIHEFLHACLIPNFLKSDKVYLGINGLNAFVYTTEKIKKVRFLIISITPFFLLSVVLPFILDFLGWLNGYTILLCLINAMASSVDCFNLCLVAIQVPRGAYIVSNGFETYFKSSEFTPTNLMM